MPPRIHNLLRLAELSDVELDGEIAEFLGKLNGYYVQSRYPEEIQTLGLTIKQKSAKDALAKTEEIIQWLFSMLE